MILAGDKEGQVNVSILEFIHSEWFRSRLYKYILAMNECFINTTSPTPEAMQYMAIAKQIMRTNAVCVKYCKWALGNFDTFIDDYIKYIENDCGVIEGYVPYSTPGVKWLHKQIMKNILPRWLDYRLGRPSTIWHIDNTDQYNSYDQEQIKIRYGIGKKHFSEETERRVLKQKAAARAARESNSKAGPDNNNDGSGVRTLSPQDLELF